MIVFSGCGCAGGLSPPSPPQPPPLSLWLLYPDVGESGLEGLALPGDFLGLVVVEKVVRVFDRSDDGLGLDCF